jgi:hypothetical protein
VLASDSRWLVPAVLGVIAVIEYFIVGATVLPATAARPGVRPSTTATLGYAYACAVSTYGVVAAFLTGEGWVAIPFGVLALLTWQRVNGFLSTTYRDTLGPGD